MMSPRSAAFFAGVSIFAAMTTLASAAEIHPTTLMLDRDKPIATLHIRNDTPKPTTYEMIGFRWRQENSEDIYTRDANLIISPPILTLAPEENAVIRVGLLDTGGDDPRERAFRLLISDISAPTPASGGLNVRLQILLPVFLAAETPGHEVDLSLSRTGDGPTCVAGRNEGRSHAKMVWLDGAALNDKLATHQYFLSGAQTEVCFDGLLWEEAAQGLKAGLTSTYQHGITEHEIQTRYRDAAVLRDK